MIGRLKGVLLLKRPPHLLVDVGGVGYELQAPMSTFYVLPTTGQSCELHTHLVVRDDAHLLFGFSNEGERSLFRALIKVNGVGAKVALAILSGVSVEEFGHCVNSGDIAALTRLPGIGKKTAERLVVEMRDKLDGVLLGAVSIGDMAMQAAVADPSSQACEALMALGYKAVEASKMVKAVAVESNTTEQLIRRALQSTQR